jgi:hypothetical protein
MDYFPVFYKEMLTFFNECKKDKTQLIMSQHFIKRTNMV